MILNFFYINNVKPLESEDKGDIAKYLKAILLQIDALLHFVSACHSVDWIEYLTALEKIIKYFFARDLFYYSRLIPVNLA